MHGSIDVFVIKPLADFSTICASNWKSKFHEMNKTINEIMNFRMKVKNSKKTYFEQSHNIVAYKSDYGFDKAVTLYKDAKSVYVKSLKEFNAIINKENMHCLEIKKNCIERQKEEAIAIKDTLRNFKNIIKELNKNFDEYYNCIDKLKLDINKNSEADILKKYSKLTKSLKFEYPDLTMKSIKAKIEDLSNMHISTNTYNPNAYIYQYS